MKNMNITVATLILGLALPLTAQTKPEPKPTPVVQPVPELTKTETLAVKQLSQEFTEFQKAQAQINGDIQDFIETVEKDHPGYTFDSVSGKLIAKPQAAKKTLEKK